MKNIAHFATGLLAASFVPGVMEQATQGGLLIALGGACAMLPDVLDFRFARFLAQIDACILPDATHPDAQQVAEQVAAQMALALQNGRPRAVQLHPARVSAAEWVCYAIHFDDDQGDVVVALDEGGRGVEGRAHVGPIENLYGGTLRADELGGPYFRFSPVNGAVRVEFLPWHRQWSHSFVLSVVLGLLVFWLLGPLAGIVAALGYAAHILVDEGGYMGSNLFAPFTRKRRAGLKLYHSADAIPNMVTVWVSLTLLLLNMDRVSAIPQVSVGPYLAFVVALPSLLLLGVYLRRAWQRHVLTAEAQHQRELEDEAESFGE